MHLLRARRFHKHFTCYFAFLESRVRIQFQASGTQKLMPLIFLLHGSRPALLSGLNMDKVKFPEQNGSLLSLEPYTDWHSIGAPRSCLNAVESHRHTQFQPNTAPAVVNLPQLSYKCGSIYMLQIKSKWACLGYMIKRATVNIKINT